MLPITAARHERRDGYPLLILSIAGREATISSYLKRTFAGVGMVPLGEEFADLVPDIQFQIPGEPDNILELRGWTADPRVFALWDRFATSCNDGTFAPGPIAVPDEAQFEATT